MTVNNERVQTMDNKILWEHAEGMSKCVELLQQQLEHLTQQNALMLSVLKEFSMIDKAIVTDDCYGDGLAMARGYVANKSRDTIAQLKGAIVD